MAKQIEKTPQILDQMKKVLGDGVDVTKLPVYEAVALNTLPIQKRGSIYDKAVNQQSVLDAMASAINTGGLPLHTLHNQGGELPSGKVFHAQVVSNALEQAELHVLFSVDPTLATMVAGMDNGTIDEVSLGFLAAHALCSDCGWDFFGDDASLMNFFDRMCENGHAIGQDGVHLSLTGLDKAYEMSLVSAGAVQGSKILSPSQAKLTGQVGQRLAATGLDGNALVLFASTKLEAPRRLNASSHRESLDMAEVNLTEMVTQLSTTKAEVIVKDAKIVDLTAQITAKDALLTAKDAEIVELKAKIPASATEIETKLTAANAQLTPALAFMREQAKKALVATAGDPATADAMSVADLTKTIGEAQVKLSTLFPAGGKTLGTTEAEVADAATKKARNGAFTTRK